MTRRSIVSRAAQFLLPILIACLGASVPVAADPLAEPDPSLLSAPLEASTPEFSSLQSLGAVQATSPAEPTALSVYFEDFEGDAPGWNPAGDWEIGEVLSTPGTGAFGNSTGASGTNLSGQYDWSVDHRLLSPTIDLPFGAYEYRLRFDEWSSVAFYQDWIFGLFGGLSLYYSTDHGATWRSLRRDAPPNPTWATTEYRLHNATPGETISFRFDVAATPWYDSYFGLPHGWFIDNVEIIAEEVEPVQTTLVGLNAQTFPFVFTDVRVEHSPGLCPGVLDETNFQVYEDGVLQTDRFEVTPPDELNNRLADIVFIMDNSGSMGDEQAAVINNIESFVDGLNSNGVSCGLGLTRYGQSSGSGAPRLEENGALTDCSDSLYFKNNVLTRNRIDGGREPGYEAIKTTAEGFVFRPGSLRVLIEITDETPAQGSINVSQAGSALDTVGADFFAVTLDSLFSHFDPLVEDELQLIDILQPFDQVLDFVLERISNTYRIRYRAFNDALDGVEREVRIVTNCGDYDAEVVGYYNPGSAPRVERTAETIELGRVGQEPDQPLAISVRVTDQVSPLAQSVQLWYRNLGNTSFTGATMSLIDGTAADGIWRAQIPAGAVDEPGVAYYVVASDGEVSSSDPSSNPSSNPYILGVLPNQPPSISHTPFPSAHADQALDITATIVDTTNVLASTTLYFRESGAIGYEQVAMSQLGGDLYGAAIPADTMTVNGAEYYISATDDYGAINTHGTADAPHLVAAIIPVPYAQPSPASIELALRPEVTLSRQVRVHNVGNAALEIQDAFVSTDDCATPVQESWLETNPDTMPAVLPGESRHLDLTLNASVVPVGTSASAALCVTSNDPYRPTVQVPVDLTVDNYCPSEADFNTDGMVDNGDLFILFASWGQTGVQWAAGDATGDGMVNAFDYLFVIQCTGPTAPADSPVAEVPNVTGLSRAEAQAQTLAAGLSLGELAEEGSEAISTDMVISQGLLAGSVLPAGTPMDLVVSLGPRSVLVPDVIGLSASAAGEAAQDAGLQIGTVTEQHSNATSAGDVMGQSPAAGTTVLHGAALDLIVSKGPTPVTVPSVVGLEQSLAEGQLTGAGLSVGGITEQHDRHVPNGAVIAQSPAGGSSVAPGSSVDLVISIGPEPVSVPDVVGLERAVAEQAIIAADLIVGTLIEQDHETVPEDHVISQDPASGQSILPGSAVDLLISRGSPPVEVPNVVGLTQAAAETAINNAGLTVDLVVEGFSDTVAVGYVITQDPEAGTIQERGTGIDILISKGPEPVTVPNLIGFAQADAEVVIAAIGLTVGTITEQSDEDTAAGTVLAHTPSAGESVPPDTVVDLIVSTGPPPVTVPDVVGQAQADAVATISEALLNLGTVTLEASDTIDAGNVISQDPVGGTSVPRWSTVDLRVSSGPPPVTVPDVTGLVQAAAETAITEADLTVGVIGEQPSAEVPAGNVIEQSPTAGTSVPPGTAVNLLVSNGPPPIEVPDLTGLSQAAAETALVDAGLAVGEISLYPSPSVAAGNVLGQSILGGSTVPPGTAIDLYISSGPPPVLVPGVIGVAQATAEAALIDYGLTIGTVTEETSATIGAGRVTQQDPGYGASVPPGTSVDLVISSGPPPVNVPQLVGLSNADAQAALLNAGLGISGVGAENSETVPADIVLRQDPAAGTLVAADSSVYFVVSNGADPTALVPDVVGQTQGNAETLLANANLVRGAVSIQASETVPSGSVIAQSPAAGSTVNVGSAVNLLISSGSAANVSVPDVVGDPQAAAESAIAEIGLLVGGVVSQNSASVPAGTVIGQIPSAGSLVAPGTTVDLIVSAGTAPVSVPNVVGTSEGAANPALTGVGLMLGDVSREYSDTVGAGEVISQDPTAGTNVPVGTAVNLVVSRGPLTAIGDYLRPEIDLTITPDAIDLGETIQIQIDVNDDVAVIGRTLTVDGTPLTVDASGNSQFTPQGPGIYLISANAWDAAGNEGQVTHEVRVRAENGDLTRPTVAFAQPAADALLKMPTSVVGTVTDDVQLARYVLEYSSAGESNYVRFAEGTTAKNNEVLGTFDPTMMRNGLYDVRLTAEDTNGNIASVSRVFEVDGNAKIGNFTMSFQDLVIPVSGIPITITRTYDSRVKEQGDFGIGWSLSMKDVELSENGVPGEGWAQRRISGGYSLYPTRPHTVTITLGDNDVHRFGMVLYPTDSFLPFNWAVPTNAFFVADSETDSELVALDSNTGLPVNWVDGTDVGNVELWDYLSQYEVYDPERYELTLAGGTIIRIHETQGIEQITDTNGNQLTFTRDGIIHSSGKSVLFARDSMGRIAEITDPRGSKIVYEYDSYGDLVSVIDQSGNRTAFRYDASHNLTAIIDPRGNIPARHEYDEAGRLVATVDSDGNRIAYSHDIEGREEVVTDRNGNPTRIIYDDDGNVLATTDALGHTTTSTYDADGNRLTQTDALGHTTSFTYDSADNLLSVTDALGNTTSYTYNSRKQPTTVTDALGRTTSFQYDASGNLLTQSDPYGRTETHQYSSDGNRTGTINALGHSWSFAYDNQGNRISVTHPNGAVTTDQFDLNGNRIAKARQRTDENGTLRRIDTSAAFDLNNRMVRLTDPVGAYTAKTYNDLGKIAAFRNARGDQEAYFYDEMHRLSRKEYPDGTWEEFGYDAEGNLVSLRDRAGQLRRFEYDALNRRITTIFEDGDSIRTVYDSAGRRIAEIDENGHRTEFSYDAAGRLVSETSNGGATTTHTYDAVGNRLSTTDERGNVTRFTYDLNDRLITTEFADGAVENLEYDAVGNLVARIDENAQEWRYAYDAANRLTTVTDPLGNAISFSYDELGNRTGFVDALGRTTQTAYDDLGRATHRRLPLGMTEYWSYDESGNVTQHTDFKGAVADFAYDAHHRLVREEYQDGSVLEYTYTDLDRLASVQSARGLTTFVYDRRGRMLATTNPDASWLNWEYDGAGNVTRVITANGETTHAYDADGNLTETVAPDGEVIARSYDAAGNLVGINSTSGVSSTLAYDVRNQISSISHIDENGNSILGLQYERDDTGRITRVTESSGAVLEYTYDLAGRLVGESFSGGGGGGSTDFEYDAVGNRVAKVTNGLRISYTYDNNDRLVSEGNASFAFDENGNLTEQVIGGETIRHSYDSQNRLIGVASSDSSVAFTYDFRGLRVASSSASGTSQFLFDANQYVPQVLEVSSTGNANDSSYTFGQGLTREIRNGEGVFYLQDHLGSTRVVVGEDGGSLAELRYDAFGGIRAETGTRSVSVRFGAEWYDEDVGAYYLRARYYDPRLGRFLSQDPVPGSLYDPISWNDYGYANADPVGNVDPLGLFALADQLGTASFRASEMVRSVMQFGVAAVWRSLYLGTFNAGVGAVGLAADGDEMWLGNMYRYLPSVKPGSVARHLVASRAGRRAEFRTGYPHWGSFEHIRSVTNGSPDLLTRRLGSASRKWTKKDPRCDGTGQGTGWDCDEYPFASTMQGGYSGDPHYPSLMPLPLSENRSHGGFLGFFYWECGIFPGLTYMATTFDYLQVTEGICAF